MGDRVHPITVTGDRADPLLRASVLLRRAGILDLNFTNRTVGPIFKQLYIRQAMQDLVNQPQISKDVYHGLAYPTYGPIPIEPKSSCLDSALLKNPYPYSVSNAKKLLSSHGWTVKPEGTDTCAKPGTGAGECGAGISSGEQLNFTEEVGSGSAPFTAENEEMQSSWSLAGIHVTLKTEAESQIYSSLGVCENGNSGCNWEMANGGQPGGTATYSPEYLPTPGPWFATNGANNVQGFSNSELDAWWPRPTSTHPLPRSRRPPPSPARFCRRSGNLTIRTSCR